MDIRDIVMSTGMSARPEFYSGYGIDTGNLNSNKLERIHEGIKKYYGDREAKEFVKFVTKIPVMSATVFLTNLYDFVRNGFNSNKVTFDESDIATPRGEGSIMNLFAVLATASQRADKSSKKKLTKEEREHEEIRNHYMRVKMNAEVRRVFLLTYDVEPEDAKEFKKKYGTNTVRFVGNNSNTFYNYQIKSGRVNR